jgi:polysaccharide export outer membrane protein
MPHYAGSRARFACGVLLAGLALAQHSDPGTGALLAPGDSVAVKVLDLDEIGERTVKIDAAGFVNLPVAGRLPAGGHTPEWLQAEITSRLRIYLKQPAVTVTVTELHEDPVSVTGQVNSPGIRPLRGNKGLLEAISEAGGFKPDAGPYIQLTRAADQGPIPHPSAKLDATGKFYGAQIEIASLLNGQNPGENIPLRPHDIVAVPPAGMVYVLGEVGRPGAYDFPSPSLSLLNALARAGGASRNADSSRVRVLRVPPGKTERMEFVVNLNRMLNGKSRDFLLEPQDILYVPTNKGKVVTTRALEAMIGTGSSIVVFRGSR